MLITKNRIIFISIILILIAIAGIYVTYAVDESSTSEYDMALNFELSTETSSEMMITAGKTKTFDIDITNPYDDIVQYGVAYKMINPTTLPEGLKVSYLSRSKNPSVGIIEAYSTLQVSLIVENKSTSDVTISFSIINGYKYGGDLVVKDGKKIIRDKYFIRPADFNIININVNNSNQTGGLPPGMYTMTSDCDNATYNKLNQSVIFENFTGQQDCELNFITDTNYPLLNTMQVGDYVAYVGNNGCKNGETAVTGTSIAESGNSCLGENANQPSGNVDTNGEYGYCVNEKNRFYTTGWRIAYIENNKVHLVSAGAPECLTCTKSANNADCINSLNTQALKYCNATYADGGSCPTDNSNTWAIGNDDFENITYLLTGTESGLTSAYNSTSCYNATSRKRCGYNNDMIDNGGYYWFAAYYTSGSNLGVFWRPTNRIVIADSYFAAYGVRPVIRLSSSVYVTGGKGTMDEPYMIGI